jgi:hypothetical protein
MKSNRQTSEIRYLSHNLGYSTSSHPVSLKRAETRRENVQTTTRQVTYATLPNSIGLPDIPVAIKLCPISFWIGSLASRPTYRPNYSLNHLCCLLEFHPLNPLHELSTIARPALVANPCSLAFPIVKPESVLSSTHRTWTMTIPQQLWANP